METDKEIAKLVNVLRQTARMAMQVEWTGGNQDAAAYCVSQYNRVLARLKELDSNIAAVFEPLPAGSSLTVAAMACRQLAAYYDDRTGRSFGWGGGFGIYADPNFGMWIDREAMKGFWCKSGADFKDIGEIIREAMQEFARRKKHRGEKQQE